MCGIIGYNSKVNGKSFVLQGLKNLEYRGYDSCGISLINNGEFDTYKSILRIENLQELIKTDGKILIAHTRWATHGKADLVNCHPVISKTGRFVIVHNGIIENYQKLKDDFFKGTTDYFKTNTDTEVIINLLEYYVINLNIDIGGAINKVSKQLEGTFACLIIDKLSSDKIWFMKRKSPLLLGAGNGYFIVSDLIAFPDSTKKYLRLNDGNYGYITNQDCFIFQDGLLIEAAFVPFMRTNQSLELGSFHHYMEKEIYEQPSIINSYFEKYFNDDLICFNSELLNVLKNSERIYLVASGTSYHSALLGSYFFNNIAKIESYAHLASEFLIDKHLFSKNAAFIVISQSGETADVIKAIEQIHITKQPIIAITNVDDSTIATLSTFVINIYAKREIAVASTKAYTASSTILYLLANALSNNLIKDDLKKATHAMEQSFNHLEQIRKIATLLAPKEHLFFLGKQIDYLLAMEASLKLKEISYIHSESFASGELKHGTIALITEGTPVIAFITNNEVAMSLMMSIEEVKARGARVIKIISKEIECPLDEDTIVIEQTSHYLSYLPLSVIFQLFAYYVALERGTDIDKPRNLAKSVTVN